MTGKKNAPKDSEAEKDRPVLEADLVTPVNSKGHSKPAVEEVEDTSIVGTISLGAATLAASAANLFSNTQPPLPGQSGADKSAALTSTNDEFPDSGVADEFPDVQMSSSRKSDGDFETSRTSSFFSLPMIFTAHTKNLEKPSPTSGEGFEVQKKDNNKGNGSPLKADSPSKAPRPSTACKGFEVVMDSKNGRHKVFVSKPSNDRNLKGGKSKRTAHGSTVTGLFGDDTDIPQDTQERGRTAKKSKNWMSRGRSLGRSRINKGGDTSRSRRYSLSPSNKLGRKPKNAESRPPAQEETGCPRGADEKDTKTKTSKQMLLEDGVLAPAETSTKMCAATIKNTNNGSLQVDRNVAPITESEASEKHNGEGTLWDDATRTLKSNKKLLLEDGVMVPKKEEGFELTMEETNKTTPAFSTKLSKKAHQNLQGRKEQKAANTADKPRRSRSRSRRFSSIRRLTSPIGREGNDRSNSAKIGENEGSYTAKPELSNKGRFASPLRLRSPLRRFRTKSKAHRAKGVVVAAKNEGVIEPEVDTSQVKSSMKSEEKSISFPEAALDNIGDDERAEQSLSNGVTSWFSWKTDDSESKADTATADQSKAAGGSSWFGWVTSNDQPSVASESYESLDTDTDMSLSLESGRFESRFDSTFREDDAPRETPETTSLGWFSYFANPRTKDDGLSVDGDEGGAVDVRDDAEGGRDGTRRNRSVRKEQSKRINVTNVTKSQSRPVQSKMNYNQGALSFDQNETVLVL